MPGCWTTNFGKLKRGGGKKRVKMQKWFKSNKKEGETRVKLFFANYTVVPVSPDIFAIRGAALTPSGARRAAVGPWGGAPGAGCVPRNPASPSSSRNVLQKLHETLLERVCSPPSATQWGGSMLNTRVSFHIEGNTAEVPERGRNAEGTTSQQGSPSVEHRKCSLSDGHLCMHTEQIGRSYHPTTKSSISLWSLYHGPMLCLKKLRENC